MFRLDELGRFHALTSGTAAIFHALAGLEDSQRKRVLVPAYHCHSMVEPILARGGTPVFFHVTDDLSVNLSDFSQRLSSECFAAIVPHYFGFPQTVSAKIKSLCDMHDVRLIEDCAHAFFQLGATQRIGLHGDYVVGSVVKFFPTNEGGCLIARENGSKISLSSPGLSYELKNLMNLVERSASYGRLKFLHALLFLPQFIRSKLMGKKRKSVAPRIPEEQADAPVRTYQYLNMKHVNSEASRVTRFLLRCTSSKDIIENRRRNYGFLLDALGKLEGGRPLFPELPDDVVPYMFPFYIDEPMETFAQLKNKGVPIYRWDECFEQECGVSSQYARHLLQFPCHQELTAGELNWMVDTIKQVLGQG